MRARPVGSPGYMPVGLSAPALLWEQLDLSNRWLGQALDGLGSGPVETPSRVVFARRVLTLRAYGDRGDDGPVVLMVPAPIKRYYLWDLEPRVSAVRQCLRAGFRVYLAQWLPPGPDDQGLGLAEYADQLILDCLQAIADETGRRQVSLMGHSLGGTQAAIFAALHPERVQGLVLLAAPLHFGLDAGPFGPLVAAAPRAQLLAAAFGNAPGSFLDTVSSLAAPVTFQWARWLDWLGSLADGKAWQTHLQIERWLLDQTPLPRRLYEEIVELLYREDQFLRGRLLVGGQPARPEAVDAPVLSTVYPRCAVAPPETVLPFHQAVRSTEKRVLWYPGDVGVGIQHLGILVGRRAHRYLWPQILRWMHERC